MNINTEFFTLSIRLTQAVFKDIDVCFTTVYTNCYGSGNDI